MRKRFILTFSITGLLAGVLLTWQFSSKIPVPGNFPGDEIQAKDDLLKDFLDEQSYLQSRIVSLRKDLEESQGKIEQKAATANLELLETLKKDIGLTEISGEGLEITLDDSPAVKRSEVEVTDLNLIQASDLRDVVNLLNAAKADAISINNQRIISTTPLSSVGTTILVNNSHIAPPFVINAVGDPEIMLQRLLNKLLLPDLYEKRAKSKIKFEIMKRNRITIGIYNGDLKVSYLNLVNK